MKAVCWHGKNDVQVMTVPDPSIINPQDAIIKITTTAICGSDLHLYDGYIPTMEKGDILGHEFMGEVVETGSARRLSLLIASALAMLLRDIEPSRRTKMCIKIVMNPNLN
jgi:threonine dehydrogenase-like Zn-dependent dehydrogenase